MIIPKSPDEVIVIPFDFTSFIEEVGEPVISFDVGISQVGITVASSVFISGVCRVRVSGGTTDWDYVVGVRVTTASGLKHEIRHVVQVRGFSIIPVDGGVPALPVGTLFLGDFALFLIDAPLIWVVLGEEVGSGSILYAGSLVLINGATLVFQVIE